ncbi:MULTISPECIES: NAD(P)-dependent alcohol dehydrogenase [Leptolyngbya]|jgi:NADPH:quinone reductase-like Zn-dependent oxidoreductase|uniref:Zinc-binding oxidoreductase n=1 Tax=Leptolyngbya boryana NIES-2135 TaxID=1973484 RepID=A0A1Z4JD77_LEPBY|nr:MULTISPECIES: NAD(P)-dependent alcohol dehydrogenase [Leptolyngbya]BAY54660.1 zinc-binding oxidoreductase [Leptolyngbya boryana NIES-2135]MBD1857910.1 NAD(P)-dependent alcohol dehydrogenase [Leptolyngbya sp. FACHB-1624]MBD2365653.1 NAD(P)-dependent alcohol dehydrogenase [Leptolyngbya sp. FACHB-161]MBD2371833.1 NAD(P)-dependent alcohol dehydrogenase [Leptolyngbya sp. FACHB-238]MBD2396258.1 NAD(P)-dependent alcohol dehydrogenase [Leptolyngbya sp. FACHB-239]
MKAIVQTQYGSSDTLSLQEVDSPTMTDQSVLVRVHATSVNSGDWHLMRGSPFLVRFIYGSLLKPKLKILGFDVAGRVEAVGKAVTQFNPGDEVFGDLSECGFGAFAEYVCCPETALVHKPITASFEEAATVPGAALTALQGLRDVGQLQLGQRVLINGASGGVGSFAVQIAKILGAEVTAVCNSQKLEKVRSLGADHVIDYTQIDITQARQQYDLMLDAAGFRSVFDYLPTLVPQGTYVMVGGSTVRLFQVLLFGSIISSISRRKVKGFAVKPNQTDLLTLKAWMEAGKLMPLIDQCYPLSELPTAIRRLEQRQVTGKVAIRV